MKNVRIVNIWIFCGPLVAGLVFGQAPLRAQPGTDPVSKGSNSVPAEDEPTSSEDESFVIDDADSPWSRGVSIADRKIARNLLLEGIRLAGVPLFDKAAEQFTLALRKWKHPAIYYNLALAQLYLGKEIDARENLERALEYGEKPLGRTRFQAAQKQLEEVKHQLGRIRVTCRTAGAEVTLDGVTLFIGPGTYEGWVKVKSHEITVKKTGYLSEARRVTILPEKIQDIELKLVTLSQATDANRRWATWKPWAVVAAGAAVAAAGGGLHALSSKNFNAYDEGFLGLTCATPSEQQPTPGCKEGQIPGTLSDQLARARQQQTIAVGAYIAGGTMITAGILLLYLNRPRLAEQRTTSTSIGSVIVTPAISADMFGVLINVDH